LAEKFRPEMLPETSHFGKIEVDEINILNTMISSVGNLQSLSESHRPTLLTASATEDMLNAFTARSVQHASIWA